MAAIASMIDGGGLATPSRSQPASPHGSLFAGLSPLPMGLDAQVNASLRAADPNGEGQPQEYGDTWDDHEPEHTSAMVPSSFDYANIVDYLTLFQWAGVPSELDVDGNSVLRHLLEFMGAPPAQHFRALAQVSVADFKDGLSNWNLMATIVLVSF